MRALKAEIIAHENAMADAAHNFNPDVKGDEVAPCIDGYATLQGHWCICKPGTVATDSENPSAKPFSTKKPASPDSPVWYEYSYNKAVHSHWSCTPPKTTS